ncbi:DUF3772 domain-containing protein [Hyphomicrobium sp.]|uniref:DUF3772 domain-containing protein n=1 Tax=Hyphomicrobium sp. TaxID=82 RepID=UPI002E37AA04|nr:DUF3772 domain-containing protein [Hyphomicrobium sp.]HEX2843220.1 DUF3772 domain-containing protein [Hyphomicrobium sp.]
MFFERTLSRFSAVLLQALVVGSGAAAFTASSALAQPPPAVQQKAPAPPTAPTQAPNATAQPPAGAEAQPPAEPPPPPPPPPLSQAEQQEIADVQRPVDDLKTTIDGLEKAVERNKENVEELSRLRGEVLVVFDKARLITTALAPKAEALRQQIEKLGPAPAKDAPPETEQVAAERARLSALAAGYDGAIKNTELVLVRARQLRDTVQVARQNLFATQLLKRSPSPLAPSTWQKLVTDVPGAWRQIGYTLSDWGALASRKATDLTGLLAGVVALFLILTALVNRFLAYRLDAPRQQPPSFFVQATTIGWVAPLKALPAFAAVAALWIGLDTLHLLTLEVGQIADKSFPALYVFVGVSALTRAILQPGRPSWRLVDLSTAAARRLTRIITGIAAVFAGDLILQEAIARLYLPFSISVMETALACIAIALLMLQLVRTPFESKPVAAPPPAPETPPEAAQTPARAVGPVPPLSPYAIKLPLLLVAVSILTLSLSGYIGLGRFITQQVVVTGSVVAVLLVFHLAIRAMLGAPGTGIKPFATVLEEKTGLDPAQSGALTRALSLLLNGGLALAAVPLILITWGASASEALAWLRAAVFGFQIGEFRISLARILFAAVLFLALVFATRLVQRWLDRGLLKSQRIDQGIADSIHTAVGYAGFILAVLAAISYGGLDITNFAIVAGALSVGIGFGLQSIINNFVSGLILLVERPIKVGDRVAVKGQEGFVRRISVRSTEIETADKASLIVPNSDLITSTVTNWTHRNALGAVSVKVAVATQSDAEQVRDILQKVGAESPLVLQHPPPSVTLDNFGLNGLEFTLAAVVPDVTKAGAVQSDLRFRILKAFRQARIEIPNAQHDVHLRDLDTVRTVLTRLAEERMRQSGVATPDPKKA